MQSNEIILTDSSEKVARAIFSPMMIDAQGRITANAFALRHKESYISVNRLSVPSWLDDIKTIPQNRNRVLFGYSLMAIGDVISQGFKWNDCKVDFFVADKSSRMNKSHAGIFICFDSKVLKGNKDVILSPLDKDTNAPALALFIQMKLAKLANKQLVIIGH
jgi:hypothetical protein